MHAGETAEVEILLAKITIDVVELQEAEACRLVTSVEETEMASVGDDVVLAARETGEDVVEKIETADEARSAVLIGVQYVGVRKRDLPVLLPEARGHLSLLKDPLAAKQVVEEETGRPRR